MKDIDSKKLPNLDSLNETKNHGLIPEVSSPYWLRKNFTKEQIREAVSRGPLPDYNDWPELGKSDKAAPILEIDKPRQRLPGSDRNLIKDICKRSERALACPVGETSQASATCRSSGAPANQEKEEKTENIIIIGAEKHYDSFWYKMMFMSCGYAVAAGTLKPNGWTDADITTVLVVSNDYSEDELAKMKELENKGKNIEVIFISSLTELIKHLNRRNKQEEIYKINRLAIFTHGYIWWDKDGVIALRYDDSLFKLWLARDEIEKQESRLDEASMSISEEWWLPKSEQEQKTRLKTSAEKERRVSRQVELMALNQETIPLLHKDIFSASAIFYSYACSTAAGIDGNPEDGNPHAEDSLARFIANYFKIKVRAFYRRTDYKYVMIPKEEYDNKGAAISTIVRQKRAGGFEGQSFAINEEYEALRDPENGYGGWSPTVRALQVLARKGGPLAEGTTGYALWRKGGALSLPAAAESPKKFPDYMDTFEPDGK